MDGQATFSYSFTQCDLDPLPESPQLRIWPAQRLLPAERQDLAVQVFAGAQPVAELARQHEVSRKFLYQQADIAGLDLKRRVLDRLVALDPEPAELEAALAGVIAEFGRPDGPTRAICQVVLQEWEDAACTPGLTEWLIEQAVREGENPGGRVGRRRRAAPGENRERRGDAQ